MPRALFAHVEAWVFDLDHTLYPPSAQLLPQIEARMTAWVMDRLGIDRAQADALRVDYWRRYGTTLAGLMNEHAVDPAAYLAHVHDVPLDAIGTDATLAARIGALPGRRIVFTNGTRAHADRVIAARGLSGLFDAVYGVEAAGYRPKPHRAAFDAVFAADGLTPARAAMVEDDPRNLHAPHAMGLRTVHVADEAVAGDHIHHHTDDLSAFLARLV